MTDSPALTLEEAQARVLALAPAMPVKRVAATEAVGRYLAEDLVARRAQPSADLSAMDGYALCGVGSWRIVGESRAGAPFDSKLMWGQCVRISTGAHMPAGADRVLIREEAELLQPDLVTVSHDIPPGQHVRKCGFDFAEGDKVLAAGTRIGPAQLALAISAGHGQLPVRRAPRVAVLDSGDELAADPADCGDHQIPASNGAMIAAMLGALGCEVLRIGPVADDAEALAAALEQAEGADILVTSGGASVGDHDLIRPALEAWGARIDFWKVAMKPGKPVMVATRGTQVILGLPGNPVSSFVTCFHFVMPLVRAAMGASMPVPRKAMLVCGTELPAIGGRREFLRAAWDGTSATLVDSQDSSALASLAAANCLIDRPAGSEMVEAGTSVPAYLLENGGIA
ncbi:molybdopterin molybdotransferase MoeA [Altererythrobacter litoralis]|uniref:Molybdopterin molybdenumtransferase n=1 Tax=Altererythrobacter litoralis TaxID=3113904 RepID=A0ABU7GB80_9SPHN|nr:gephyrin-like molybdotransferase Glp [Erythrobacteraceae bacterium 1XM1-14]